MNEEKEEQFLVLQNDYQNLRNQFRKLRIENKELKEELRKFNALPDPKDCYDFDKHYKDEEE